MVPLFLTKIQQLLRQHEGYRRYIYLDTTGNPVTGTNGKLTAGIGRNMQDNGLSLDEAMYLLKNDISACDQTLRSRLKFYDELDEVRQAMLIDLCFNMGIVELLKFEMLNSLASKHYAEAVIQLKNTLWYSQVGKERSDDIIKMLATGKWPDFIKQ